MVAPHLLLILSLTGAPSATPPLRLDPRWAPLPPSHAWSLAQPSVEGSATRRFLAQPSTPSDAVVTSTAGPSTSGACELDCERAREADRHARYVFSQRASVLRAHRVVGLVAWGSMLVTEVFGTLQLVNQPTWFGGGECAHWATYGAGADAPFGCGSSRDTLAGLHEAFAIATVGLYATSAVLAVAAPDPDDAAGGSNRAASRLRLHRALGWVHAAGMIVMPFLGLLSVRPQALGLTPSESLQSSLRTVHAVVGYMTFAAFTVSTVIEL